MSIRATLNRLIIAAVLVSTVSILVCCDRKNGEAGSDAARTAEPMEPATTPPDEAISEPAAAGDEPAHSGEAEESADAFEPWPDGPDFDTPQALVDYYNDTISARGQLNYRAYLGVIHAETSLQQRLVDLQRNAARWVELMTAVRNRFRTQTMRAIPAVPVRRPDQPAMLAEQTDDRATAWYVDLKGEEQTLHLARVDGSWRISARTIELLPQGGDVILGLDLIEPVFEAFGAIAPELTQRVKAGEFESIVEFGQTFDVAVAEYAAQHPEARAAVQEFMDRSPDLFQGRRPTPRQPAGPRRQP